MAEEAPGLISLDLKQCSGHEMLRTTGLKASLCEEAHTVYSVFNLLRRVGNRWDDAHIKLSEREIGGVGGRGRQGEGEIGQERMAK